MYVSVAEVSDMPDNLCSAGRVTRLSRSPIFAQKTKMCSLVCGPANVTLP